MEYIKATGEDLEGIYNLVQNTITTIYPKYYPKKVVEFFCQLHSKENILTDIHKGVVDILEDKGQLVGTGSHEGNHIARVFVSPCLQGRGYGSYIMQTLEEKIALVHISCVLEASLPAIKMYEKRGYVTQKHEQLQCDSGEILVYEIMEKKFR